MSELYLTQFQGNSWSLINGVVRGTPAFIFDFDFELVYSYRTLQPTLEDRREGAKEAAINYQYIKRELKMMEVEENIFNTIQWKYSQKKIMNQITVESNN